MSETRELNIKEKLFARRKRFKDPKAALLAGMFAVCIVSYLGLAKVQAAKDSEQTPYLNNMTEDGIKLNFVGDVMVGRTLTEYADIVGGDKIFENVNEVLSDADLTFANLENSVCDPDKTYKPITKRNVDSNLSTNFETLQSCIDAGINVFACANDHIFDYNEKSIAGLVKYFEENDINYSGIADKREELLDRDHTITVGDKTIGFLSVTDVYPEQAVSFTNSERPVVLGSTYQEYTSKVLELSQNCDLTIVYFHWGTEGALDISERQETLAHQLIDAGADIVIGTHPQVLQSIEKYRDGLIIYSLGNFVYDHGYVHNNDSVLVQFSLDENNVGQFRFVPIRIDYGKPEITASGTYRSGINAKLNQRLSKDDYYYDEQGCLRVTVNLEN